MKRSFLAALALLAFTSPAVVAQSEAPRSPYAGWEERPVKALSESEVRGLLDGEGLGYALAAELNGWPGPRHVLDLSATLGLSADQRTRVEAIHDRMKARAREVGVQLVAAEGDLDDRFASGAVEPAEIETAVAEVARLEGALRWVHLRAHVETRAVLTPAQVERYVEARGYASPADGEGHDPGAAGHEHGG